MSTQNTNLRYPNEWWKHKLSHADKEKIQRAVARYIVRCDLQKKYPPSDTNTAKACLVDIAYYDDRWDTVTSTKFNTYKFTAHEDCANTVRSILGTKDKLKQLI